MTTESEAGNPASKAKIFQFPARGRYAANEQPKSETVSTASFDSWYHDVAIKESKRVS
jgi:Protein of unknown function (DUF2735)